MMLTRRESIQYSVANAIGSVLPSNTSNFQMQIPITEKANIPITDVKIDIDNPNNWKPKEEDWKNIRNITLYTRQVGEGRPYPKARLKIQKGDRLYIWGQYITDDTPQEWDGMAIGLKTVTRFTAPTYADFVILAILKTHKLKITKSHVTYEPPHWDEIEVAYSPDGSFANPDGPNYLIAIPDESLFIMYRKKSIDDLSEITLRTGMYDVGKSMKNEYDNILGWPKDMETFGKLYLKKPTTARALKIDYRIPAGISGIAIAGVGIWYFLNWRKKRMN